MSRRSSSLALSTLNVPPARASLRDVSKLVKERFAPGPMGDKDTTPNLADPALPARRCALCSSYDAASRDEHTSQLHSLVDFFKRLHNRPSCHRSHCRREHPRKQPGTTPSRCMNHSGARNSLTPASPHPGGAIHLPEYLSLRVQLHHCLGSRVNITRLYSKF